MKKYMMWIVAVIVCALASFSLLSCTKKDDTIRIGVSFGVGGASRWVKEQEYMEARAKELGVQIEVRLNKTDVPKTQEQDCIEMIDSGIDVLIITPRDASQVDPILEYAKSKNVSVISYARIIYDKSVDLFVGYDSHRIGQHMGQYITDLVYEGDYIILRGDEADNNANLLYKGALRYIDPVRDNIRILLEASVPGWDANIAKEMVKEAVAQNGNKVDAILSPNDKISGACAEALAELGVTTPVAITGMDAEIDALKRIADGTQSATVYMNLQMLANTAIDEACRLAKGEKVIANATFSNEDISVDSNLIAGDLITKDNMDRVLIEGGHFTREEIYD